jgi:phosphate transport system substrate-binding protein
MKASVDGVTAAAAGAAKNMPADYRVSITNAPGADAYPISSFTWLLIPIKSADPAKGKVLHDFLEWMLDHGEAEAPALTYAPLPKTVIAMRAQDDPGDSLRRSGTPPMAKKPPWMGHPGPWVG